MKPKKPKHNYKMSQRRLNFLLQAFARGASISEACAYAQISRTTCYRWIQENPSLITKIHRYQSLMLQQALGTIQNNLHIPKIAMYYFDRFGSTKLEHEKEWEDLNAYIEYTNMSDESLQRYARNYRMEVREIEEEMESRKKSRLLEESPHTARRKKVAAVLEIKAHSLVQTEEALYFRNQELNWVR